ncbi:MAG TPA: Wadjet anti-phage system protein JetA family protein [Paenibacillaceae bacterium]
MNLFEVLPERFFWLLTGPNKRLYAEAVLLLYEQSQRERFGIRYDIMRDLLQELIETQRELGVAYNPEEEEVAEAERAVQQLTLEDAARMQANMMLRRLEALKWIDVEDRDQFQRYIVLPHYSSRILAVLKELVEARSVEYQRFAFTTYQILTGQEAKLRPCFALREALEMTLQFRQELIALYNNMKHHMEQVVRKMTIQEVLDHHFDTYKSQIVDKSYHRLKTSDHVSRYRFQILQSVRDWLLDRELMEQTTPAKAAASAGQAYRGGDSPGMEGTNPQGESGADAAIGHAQESGAVRLGADGRPGTNGDARVGAGNGGAAPALCVCLCVRSGRFICLSIAKESGARHLSDRAFSL